MVVFVGLQVSLRQDPVYGLGMRLEKRDTDIQVTSLNPHPTPTPTPTSPLTLTPSQGSSRRARARPLKPRPFSHPSLFKSLLDQVASFKRHPSSDALLPAEATGAIAVGDALVGANGYSLAGE